MLDLLQPSLLELNATGSLEDVYQLPAWEALRVVMGGCRSAMDESNWRDRAGAPLRAVQGRRDTRDLTIRLWWGGPD